MKKALTLILVASISLGLISCKDHPKDIKKSFEAYKQALLKKDGTGALKYISSGSIDYYKNFLDLSINANKEELDKLSLLKRMTVLLYRVNYTPEELKGFNGKQVVIASIKDGLIGEANTIKNTSIDKIEVTGKTAKTNIFLNGNDTGISYQFVLEDNVWKMDLKYAVEFLDAVISPQFKQMIKQKKLTEDQFMILTLEAASGKKVTTAIWDPIK